MIIIILKLLVHQSCTSLEDIYKTSLLYREIKNNQDQTDMQRD